MNTHYSNRAGFRDLSATGTGEILNPPIGQGGRRLHLICAVMLFMGPAYRLAPGYGPFVPASLLDSLFRVST
jgi:hypothetical protein